MFLDRLYLLLNLINFVVAIWAALFKMMNNLEAKLCHRNVCRPVGVVAGILRPIAGWIGDRPQVNRLYLVGGSGIFCGIVAGVSISFNTFGLMIVYALFAGIGGGIQHFSFITFLYN